MNSTPFAVRVACFISLVVCVGCIADSSSALDDLDPIDMAMNTATPDSAMADGGGLEPVDVGPETVEDVAQPTEPVEPSCEKEDRFVGNQSQDTAEEITLGFASDELFICPETQDWYRLTLEEGQQVTIRLEANPPETDLDLALLNREGEVVASSANEEGIEDIVLVPELAGEYWILVEGYQDQQAAYALGVSGSCRLDAHCPDGQVCDRFRRQCTQAPDGTCGADENEPNDVDTSATEIESPAALQGVLCRADRDWFSFNAEAGDSYEMLVRFPEGQDIDVHVVNADTGAVIARATGDRRNNPERLNFSHLPAGEYRVGLTLYLDDDQRDRDVDYELEFVGRSGRCETDRDCSATGLPVCDDGICRAVEPGAGLGDRCGENEDCAEGADLCYTGFTGGHDNFCTIQCRGEGECGALGEGAYCQPIDRRSAICVPPCGNDDDCGVFYQCQQSRCQLRGECRVDADCEDGEICRAARTGDRYCALPSEPAACGADAGNDPNNVRSEATALDLPVEADDLNICNGDDDWYVLTVPADQGGKILEVAVEFREGVDIDVYLFDGFGNKIGESITPDQVREVVSLRFIAPGEYYARVDQFSSDRLEDTRYRMTAELIDNDEGCTADANQCAETEPLRMVCDEDSGGCVSLEGEGQLGLGERCDSSDDCSADADFCWNFEGGERFNICTIPCRGDGDCAGIDGTVCTVFQRRFGVCLPPREGMGG